MLSNFDPLGTDVVSVFSFDKIDFGPRDHFDYDFTMEEEDMQTIIVRMRELK